MEEENRWMYCTAILFIFLSSLIIFYQQRRYFDERAEFIKGGYVERVDAFNRTTWAKE